MRRCCPLPRFHTTASLWRWSLVIHRPPAGLRLKKWLSITDPLKPVLTLEEALAAKSFHNEPNFIRRGELNLRLKNRR